MGIIIVLLHVAREILEGKQSVYLNGLRMKVESRLNKFQMCAGLIATIVSLT